MQNQLKTLGTVLLLSTVVVGCSRKDTDENEDTGRAMAAAPAGAPANTEADAAAIVKADSAWLRHVMAKNVDSLMTYYTPDAVSYGFGNAPASGTDQLRAEYTEMVKSKITNPKLISNTVKFSDDGTMAFDHGLYSMSVTPPGGKTSNESGAYLNVWRRVDGQWKLVAEMSTPVPAPKT